MNHTHWQSAPARVLANDAIDGSMSSLLLQAPQVARSARGGQFVMLRPPGNALAPATSPRPFDLHSVDAEAGIVRVVFRVKGWGTRLLAGAAPGSELLLSGPFGRATDQLFGTSRSLALVGRGAGISPLVMTAQIAHARGARVRAYVSARRPRLLDPFTEALSAVATLVVHDDETQPAALVTDALDRDVAPHAIDAVLVVGSARLTRATLALGRRHAIPTYTMVEARMACGFGHCKGCAVPTTVGYLLACHDGPTVEIERLVEHAG